MKESINKEGRAAQIIAAAVIEALKTKAADAIDAKHLIAVDAATAANVIEKKRIAAENIEGISNFIYKQGTLAVAVVGVCFGVYFTFANPTKDNDTALQLQDQRISSQQKTIDGLNLTQQNDTKELKNEVAGLRTEMQTQTNKITELSTIIQERIPEKIQ